MDSRFIWSGSEDTNIRLWKSRASESLKMLLPREKEALAQSQKLVHQWIHNPEVKRISRHRHLPAAMKNKQKTLHIQRQSRKKKEDNMRLNNRPEDLPLIPNRTRDMDVKFR